MKKIGIICHVDNQSPALSAALNELVRLAARQCGWSETDFEVVEKPPYDASGPEQNAANDRADYE